MLQPPGFVPSMSHKGTAGSAQPVLGHNAVAESFFATRKAEEATAPYETKAVAHRAVAGYIHKFFFMGQCLISPVFHD